MEPEILVNISFRIPAAHPSVLADHIEPVMKAGINAGGGTFHLSMQPYTPEDD